MQDNLADLTLSSQIRIPLLGREEQSQAHNGSGGGSWSARVSFRVRQLWGPFGHLYEGPLFGWVRPYLSRTNLAVLDLSFMPDGTDIRWADALLQWELENRPERGLAKALMAAYQRPMAEAAACKLVADLLRFLPPLLLASLLSLLRPREASSGMADEVVAEESARTAAFALAVCLPLVNLAQALLVNQYFWRTLRLGVLARSALSLALYRHAVSLRASDNAAPGSVANLLGTDAGRINSLFGCIHMVWSSPLQIVIALGALLRLLGWPALAGLGVMLALWPAQVFISRATARLRARTAVATDERLERLDAALLAARAIKLQGWEELCSRQIRAARQTELGALRAEAGVKALNVLTVTLAPTLVSLATFATLSTLAGQPPQPPTVFASLALFNALRAPLSALPDLFAALSHASVAIARLEAVLTPCDRHGGSDPAGPVSMAVRSPGASAVVPARVVAPPGPLSPPSPLLAVAGGDGLAGAQAPAQRRRGSPPVVLLREASYSWRAPAEGADGGTAKCAAGARPDEPAGVPPAGARSGAGHDAPHGSRPPAQQRAVDASGADPADSPVHTARDGLQSARSVKPRYHGLDALVFSEGGRPMSDGESSPSASSRSNGRSPAVAKYLGMRGEQHAPEGAGLPRHALLSSSLHAVSLRVNRGEVLALLGEVGCGKSSLLLALLGELHRTGGVSFTHSAPPPQREEKAVSPSPGSRTDRPVSAHRPHGPASPGLLGRSLSSPPSSSELHRAAVGYSGQRAWLMRGTARDNILFGLPFDAAWYRTTVEACALDRDFADWPCGDLAEIGDRGRAVSGGQQARLALARVVYARPALCLIDDPLAALDAATRAHVWDKAVRGCLGDAAVVLATSSAALATKAHRVLVMRKGRVLQQGTPAALGAVDGAFSDLLAEASEAAFVPRRAKRPPMVHHQGAAAAPSPSPGRPTGDALPTLFSEAAQTSPPAHSQMTRGGAVAGSVEGAVAAGEGPMAAAAGAGGGEDASVYVDEGERLMRHAQPHNGDTPHAVRALAALEAAWAVEGCRAERAQKSAWAGYVTAFGCRGAVFGLAVCLFVLSQASIVLADCWLARWSSLPPEAKADLPANLGGLAAFAALAALFVALQAGLWPLLALNASNRYHSAALCAVLHAPLSALSVLPVRRVISRFSKDVDALDVGLPSMTAQAFTCLAALVSSLAAVLFATPLALPVVAAVVIVFGRVVLIYRPTAADARRLVSVLHGPVLSHTLESLDGRVYIRAFGQSTGFEQHAAVLVEAYAHAQVFNIALQRWLALRLEVLGAWMLLAVGLLAVAMRQHAALGPAGLALTYALTFTGLAKYLINYATKAYGQLASVERLTVIADLPDEFARTMGGGPPTGREPEERGSDHQGSGRSLPAAYAVAEVPPANWPQRGELRMVGYSPAAYSPAGRCVLQPMTLTIQPGEHVVLIGRSGAGKSTLLAGITRLLPPATGRIFVDGYEARDVALSRWRSALACIPQEPVLLAGSIRFNLDISAAQPEDALWVALRLSGLEMRVRTLSDGLDTPVDQAGLSGGERQSIVLARLLLRRESSRLVLLDEPAAATAGADSARLHGVLHERFAHAALIAVSHTALPFLHLFSRLLVLADGAVVEDGQPDVLLNTPASRLGSIFSEAPHRLQAHVRRMIALQRSRGLPAVRGIWRSAHAMHSEFLPDCDGATRGREETKCASGCLMGDTSGTDGAPLSSRSGDGIRSAGASGSSLLVVLGGGGSRSVGYAEGEPDAAQGLPKEGLHAPGQLERSTDDPYLCKGLDEGDGGCGWPADLFTDPYRRDHQDGEEEGACEGDASPTSGWGSRGSSRSASILDNAMPWHDVRRRGWLHQSFSTRSLPWSLPIRSRTIAADAPRPLTPQRDTAKLAAGGVSVGSGGHRLPWTVLGGVPGASEAEVSSTVATSTPHAGSNQ